VSSSKWIRIERPLPLPAYVKEAVQLLDDADHVAYVVGGSVRDFLLGRESKDHDIATSAGPDELCELFPRAVTVGKAFGVIKVPVNTPEADAPVLMEIATFREDLEYTNHRHPKGVRFSGPEEDARRRDFTINAMFYDPKTSRILDSTGGMQDLRAGVIRAIGEPSERFREDALRLLRAVRFAARLGFAIEPDTAKAIQTRAKLISKVSAERIRDELTLMWTGPRPAEALEMLSHFGLLEQVLPELQALKTAPGSPSPWTKTVKAMAVLAAQRPVRSPDLAWATLLLETAGRIEAPQGAATARTVAGRLKMPRENVERIGRLIEAQPKFRDAFKMREATLARFVREPGFEELLALHKIDATITDGNLACYEFCLSRWEELRRVAAGETSKLIDGKDLIQLGLKPGPGFSEILRVVEDLTLEHKLHSKEEALEYVVRYFVK
jgi:poly(A) polymerase